MSYILSLIIKDCKRDSRMSSSTAFNITGPCQKRPRNWNQTLRNKHFKTSLSEYLSIPGKTIFAISGNVSYSYKVVDGRVQRKVDYTMIEYRER